MYICYIYIYIHITCLRLCWLPQPYATDRYWAYLQSPGLQGWQYESVTQVYLFWSLVSRVHKPQKTAIPSQPMYIAIGSMYGIYANIGGILMVNVTIYSIHGSYGIAREKTLSNPFCYNGQRGFSLLSDMKGNKERTPAYWMRNYLYFPTIFPKKNKLNTWWCNPKLKLTWCRNKVRPPGLRFSAHHLLNIWVD